MCERVHVYLDLLVWQCDFVYIIATALNQTYAFALKIPAFCTFHFVV